MIIIWVPIIHAMVVVEPREQQYAKVNCPQYVLCVMGVSTTNPEYHKSERVV